MKKKNIFIGIGMLGAGVGSFFLGKYIYETIKEEKENQKETETITLEELDNIVESMDNPKPLSITDMNGMAKEILKSRPELSNDILDKMVGLPKYDSLVNDQNRSTYPEVDYVFNEETGENELYIHKIHWRNFINDDYDGLDIRVMEQYNDIIFSPSIIALLEVLLWNDPFLQIDRYEKEKSRGATNGTDVIDDGHISSDSSVGTQSEEVEKNIFKEKEEERILKYDKDSDAAYLQYKEMRVRDLPDNIIGELDPYWKFQFPKPDVSLIDDNNVYLGMMKERVSFFGEDSVWAKEISIAELLLYFGELADWNWDEGITYYITDFCTNLEMVADEYEDRVAHLLDYKTYKEGQDPDVYGMFGLDWEDILEGKKVYKTPYLNWWQQYQTWYVVYYSE